MTKITYLIFGESVCVDWSKAIRCNDTGKAYICNYKNAER